jgi:hypothetical protein
MSLATPESIQELQTALHDKAKKSPDSRFYSLYGAERWLDELMQERTTCRETAASVVVRLSG